MQRKLCVLVLALILYSAWAIFPRADAEPKVDIPKEVRWLEGTYVGSWTMYGIDEKGEVVKKMAWTDTMKASSAEVKDDRAFVATADEMTFEGSKDPSYRIVGKEGYFLKKDGSLGEYFIETFGQVNRITKLADNVWSYSTPASEMELGRLGFPKGASGQHVVVKVVGNEQGAETHRISRVTTVTWKDKEGKERTLQFVSLQGHHKKQP